MGTICSCCPGPSQVTRDVATEYVNVGNEYQKNSKWCTGGAYKDVPFIFAKTPV